MRELVLQMGVSIDGYVATIDGAHDWGYDDEDPATRKWKLDSVWGAGAHLMGRQTYEDMAAVWPESEIAAGELADEIARLKSEEGGYLLAHGGAKFAQALSRERLVDEYRLVIHPAALGDGLALFKDLPSRACSAQDRDASAPIPSGTSPYLVQAHEVALRLL